jgi:hypothetical protein
MTHSLYTYSFDTDSPFLSYILNKSIMIFITFSSFEASFNNSPEANFFSKFSVEHNTSNINKNKHKLTALFRMTIITYLSVLFSCINQLRLWTLMESIRVCCSGKYSESERYGIDELLLRY